MLSARLFSATFLQILGRTFSAAGTFLLFVFLGRELSVLDFGKLGFYLSIFLMLGSLADLGLSVVGLQKASAESQHAQAWIQAAIRGRFWLSIPCELILLSIVLYYGDSLWLLALSILYFKTLPLGLAGIEFQKELQYRSLLWARLGGMLFTLLLSGILAAISIWQWEAHFACFVLGWSFSNVWIYFKVGAAHASPLQKRETKVLWNDAWPLGVSNLAQQIYFQSGHFFLRSIAGEAALPFFTAPFRGFSLALMIPQYLTGAAMPLLVQNAKENPSEYRQLRRQLLLWLVLPALAMQLLVFPFAEQILTFVFGENFAQAGDSLRYLSLAGLAIAFGSVSTTCLVALGKTRIILGISLLCALFSLPVYYFSIQQGGAAGAARALCLTECCVAVLSWFLLKKEESKIL